MRFSTWWAWRGKFSALCVVLELICSSISSTKAHACQPHMADTFPGIQTLADDWSRSGHELAGRVWRQDGLIAEQHGSSCDHHPLFEIAISMSMTIGAGGIVLLGEVHDNPAHHRLRAAVLGPPRFDGEGRRPVPLPALVLEHIRTDQQPALDRFTEFNATARRLGHAGDLFRFLEWDKSGWPDQKIFEPLFSAAIQNKLPIYPGDLPRDTMRRAAREGETTVSSDERTRLKLDTPLAPPLDDALLTELEESHCGVMPKTAFGKMAFAQRYRDAHLADAVLKAAETHGSAILLAGNGHVRTDRGVPYYLRQRAPDKKVVSVLLVEVEDGKTDPQAYVARDPAGKPAADYIVLTPRQARPDPCEAMRAALKAKKG